MVRFRSSSAHDLVQQSADFLNVVGFFYDSRESVFLKFSQGDSQSGNMVGMMVGSKHRYNCMLNFFLKS